MAWSGRREFLSDLKLLLTLHKLAPHHSLMLHCASRQEGSRNPNPLENVTKHHRSENQEKFVSRLSTHSPAASLPSSEGKEAAAGRAIWSCLNWAFLNKSTPSQVGGLWDVCLVSLEKDFACVCRSGYRQR